MVTACWLTKLLIWLTALPFRYFYAMFNSDSNCVKEEFLGLVEVVGSKGAEALCRRICEVLQKKGVGVNQLRFHGLDGTNAMSVEIFGLQRRLRHTP